MKLLSDLLCTTDLIEVVGYTDLNLANVSFDSRNICTDSLFVAINGFNVDGHNFIQSAIDSGATAVVAQEFLIDKPEHVTFIKVEDSSKCFGIIASNFYNNPSHKLKLIAVTGTNGKTTIATLLHELFQSIGHKSGLLSTIENKVDHAVYESTHTTSDALAINKMLSKMVDEGCEYCFMEASSHAIHQNRIYGLEIDGAIFTNITHEHLDYHQTFDDYILAKKKLFDQISPSSFALVNKDDKHAETMLHHCSANHYTYAKKSMADYNVRVLESQFEGLLLNINGCEIWSRLVGDFNAYNLAAIFGCAHLLGLDETEALTAISTLHFVNGRFDVIRSTSGLIGIVDYAHTPDALKNVLQTITHVKSSESKIITVIGCGGDRDKDKRPIMTSVAAQWSDKIIITSDNPRNEDPSTIITDMQKGLTTKDLPKTLSISDRREAIKTACSLAQSNDVILIAGKGHEKYQEIKGQKLPFDDKEELQKTFNLLAS